MKTAYIGIGSNLGDPLQNCREAVDRMGRIPDCRILKCSQWYRTEPIGVEGQGWYVNGVASVSTGGLSAREMMGSLLAIEADMGRVRKERWEPRIIDLDILLFGDEIIQEPDLTIPHPLMHGRRFVMAPMAGLAPELMHPSLGKSMTALLKEIPPGEQMIRPIEAEAC